MIFDRARLLETCRYNDAQAEEHGSDALRRWGEIKRINLVDLAYVAHQRAIRMVMVIDGQDPTKLSRTEFTEVHLSPELRPFLNHFAATFIDGFAVGFEIDR